MYRSNPAPQATRTSWPPARRSVSWLLAIGFIVVIQPAVVAQKSPLKLTRPSKALAISAMAVTNPTHTLGRVAVQAGEAFS